MLQAKVITIDALKARQALRESMGTNKRTIRQRAQNKRLNEVIMAKHKVDLTYLKNLQAFVDRVAEDQTRSVVENEKSDIMAVTVSFETGRRYDKILIGTVSKGGKQKPLEVRYFVERATGDIYGAKSDLAPNHRWYLGNIADADQWDWSGFHGRPYDPEKAGVREVGTYGSYVHYKRIEEAESAVANAG